jgi:hypothetical protein
MSLPTYVPMVSIEKSTSIVGLGLEGVRMRRNCSGSFGMCPILDLGFLKLKAMEGVWCGYGETC